ncbi:MAG: CoA pyrophosphatase [Desulfobacterales bacterium]|jgi:8-oxo-dGTP pyrophosphatase MutT (NUDIX family)
MQFAAGMKTSAQSRFDSLMGLDVDELKDIISNDPSPEPPDYRIYKPACVFLLMFDLGEPHILAIQKADSEGYPWRNQVALPGGHLDAQDTSPLEGAFRELEEEVGISRNQVEFLGSMGHFQTINHRDIEVFTGLWKAVGPVRHDPTEISRILKIPFRVLVQTHNANNFHGRIPDVDELRYPFKDVVIWGATARILHHYIELVHPLLQT